MSEEVCFGCETCQLTFGKQGAGIVDKMAAQVMYRKHRVKGHTCWLTCSIPQGSVEFDGDRIIERRRESGE